MTWMANRVAAVPTSPSIDSAPGTARCGRAGGTPDDDRRDGEDDGHDGGHDAVREVGHLEPGHRGVGVERWARAAPSNSGQSG